MKYDLVIFDLDGTLFDTAPDIGRCLNRALAEFGLPPFPEERVKEVIGPAGKAFFQAIVPDEKDLPLAQKIVELYRSYYVVSNTELTRPFPGVKETLDTLRSLGVKMSVASNKPVGQVRNIIVGLGFAEYFEFVLGPEDVTNPKPDPEMLHRVMENSGVAPERTLMVGDTHNDMTSGKAAGATTVFVTWGYSNDVDPATIDVRVSKPEDIIPVVHGNGLET